MTEPEARDLMLNNLREINDRDGALCVTQRMMTERILQEIAGRTVSQEAMMNLRMLADAKSRLGYYALIEHDDIGEQSRVFFEGFINIVEFWEEAMDFAVKNYEAANIKENTRRSREEMKKVLEDIRKWRSDLESQIQNSGEFIFYGWERNLLNWLIDWTTRLIIGYDLFDLYAKEYRRLIACLNLLFNQIYLNPQSGSVQ